MKILVLGSGGREHALAHTFSRQGHSVYAFPGNPGICEIATPIFAKDQDAILHEVKAKKIDLTVVGPETLLEKGIQDTYFSHGLPLFGPTKRAAQLEMSKAWAKEFMAEHQIPTARFAICHVKQEALKTARLFFSEKKGVVIKPDGFTAGKGVVCCNNIAQAEQTIHEIMDEKKFGDAGSIVIVEEMLFGEEISFLVLCDGKHMVPLLAAQDHKRLYDGNRGPNTGGMGAFAPFDLSQDTSQEIVQKIIVPTLRGLQKEGILYQGVLYFGLMLTSHGPKVLEYNCRFGDPEAQAILPLLKSDLADVMMACVRGELEKITLEWTPLYSCCVVLAAKGYPSSVLNGEKIDIQKNDLLLFHANTARNEKGDLVTAGGRVLNVVGLGDTLRQAVEKTYAGIGKLSLPWSHYRTDIGHSQYKLHEITL